MTLHERMEYKRRLTEKIIDMFFDPRTEFPKELEREVALWLLDEHDSELKDDAMRRKFDEIMEESEAPRPKPENLVTA